MTKQTVTLEDSKVVELSKVMTGQTGSAGPQQMDAKRISQAFVNKEIPLQTFIKWALIHDFGLVSNVTIDIEDFISNWSGDFKNQNNKWKEINISTGDVYMAIGKLLNQQAISSAHNTAEGIQLNLFPPGCPRNQP